MRIKTTYNLKGLQGRRYVRKHAAEESEEAHKSIYADGELEEFDTENDIGAYFRSQAAGTSVYADYDLYHSQGRVLRQIEQKYKANPVGLQKGYAYFNQYLLGNYTDYKQIVSDRMGSSQANKERAFNELNLSDYQKTIGTNPQLSKQQSSDLYARPAEDLTIEGAQNVFGSYLELEDSKVGAAKENRALGSIANIYGDAVGKDFFGGNLKSEVALQELTSIYGNYLVQRDRGDVVGRHTSMLGPDNPNQMEGFFSHTDRMYDESLHQKPLIGKFDKRLTNPEEPNTNVNITGQGGSYSSLGPVRPEAYQQEIRKTEAFREAGKDIYGQEGAVDRAFHDTISPPLNEEEEALANEIDFEDYNWKSSRGLNSNDEYDAIVDSARERATDAWIKDPNRPVSIYEGSLEPSDRGKPLGKFARDAQERLDSNEVISLNIYGK